MTAPITPQPRPDKPDFDHMRKQLHAVDGRSKRTARTYTHLARQFTDWATRTYPDTPLLELTPGDVEEYLIDLADRDLAQATRRLAVYAIRALYDYLGRDHVTPTNPAREVTPPTQPGPQTVDYADRELDALLAAALADANAALACGHHSRWVRARFDHAVVATFRYTGVRLAELCSTDTDHLDVPGRLIDIRLGKGAQQRIVPIPHALAQILEAYLREVRPHCPDSPRLFANPDGYPGTGAYGQLAHRAAADTVTKYARAAGLPGRHHPHRLRHSYATDLLRRGTPLEAIRRLLGHADIHTTTRYPHLNTDDLATAIDQAFPRPHHDAASDDPDRDAVSDEDDEGGEGGLVAA